VGSFSRLFDHPKHDSFLCFSDACDMVYGTTKGLHLYVKQRCYARRSKLGEDQNQRSDSDGLDGPSEPV
jgi:hypothetical protein